MGRDSNLLRAAAVALQSSALPMPSGPAWRAALGRPIDEKPARKVRCIRDSLCNELTKDTVYEVEHDWGNGYLRIKGFSYDWNANYFTDEK